MLQYSLYFINQKFKKLGAYLIKILYFEDFN